MRRFAFMRRMSLINRLLALTVVACLPGLAALIYTSIDVRNTRYREVHAEALRNARFAVSEIQQIFDGIEGALHAVAEADEVRGSDSSICGAYLSKVRSHLPQLTSILILDPQGSARCYSEGPVPAVNLADRYYIREAIATKQFAVGDYTLSRATGKYILPVALPAAINDDIGFVISAGLNLQWLGNQLRERGIARGSAITIADRNGTIISRAPDPEKFIGTDFPTEYMYLLSSEPGSTDIQGRDGIDRILGYVPAPSTPFGLYVSSGISRAEAFSPIDRSFRNSILLFLLGSFAAFVLAWLVGNIIIRRPLVHMVATANAWRRGEDTMRTGMVGRNDEIGVLGQTFDHLMDENAQREREREISEKRREILVHELAHRVKNTLATVQSIASLSFRETQGPEALRGFHERLQALVRSHDLLTRRNWEHANLNEVAEAALAPVREDRAHRFTLSGPAVALPSSTVVPVAMILHELCTNSMKYGALSNDDGVISLNWIAQPDERGVTVSMIWTEAGGPPVTPPEHEGFGTRLISSLTRQLNGGFEVRYPPSGVVCNIRIVAPKNDNKPAAYHPAA